MIIIIIISYYGLFAGVIARHPKSRLVPIGVEVTFICQINENGANTHWNINDIPVITSSEIRSKQQEGFVIDKRRAGSIDTITLRVTATAKKNGTRIYCSSYSTHSDVATLLIIAGMICLYAL